MGTIYCSAVAEGHFALLCLEAYLEHVGKSLVHGLACLHLHVLGTLDVLTLACLLTTGAAAIEDSAALHVDVCAKAVDRLAAGLNRCR